MAVAVDHQITSEIYSDEGIAVGPALAGGRGYVTTKFYFKRPPAPSEAASARTPPSPGVGVGVRAAVEQDKDGDLVPRRRSSGREDVIRIEHSASTSLRLVGLQVWRGALLLADWVLHLASGAAAAGPGSSSSRGPAPHPTPRAATVLELGAGTGLTSIVAAMYAKEVVSTDVNVGGILDLIRSNASLNGDLVRARFTVLGLDFFAADWSPEVQSKLKEVTVIFAADVIYDVDLTEAFVRTLIKLMSVPPKKTMYFALEKRFVFTTDDFESVAPIYEHFLSYLEHCRPKSWTIEQIPLDFPQYFRYERVKQLVLWKIAS